MSATDTKKKTTLISIKNVTKKFHQANTSFLRSKVAILTALSSVSLEIYSGETLALVGESGSGKSTLGKAVLRVFELSSGKIFYRSEDISKLTKTALKNFRRQNQMIFQDPLSSLNPKMSVENIIGEAIDLHHPTTKKERKEKILELLTKVGLPADSLKKYAHNFSGGQRQRIVIARALAVQPEFVLCDEPTSALDVSIQAQIINLLQDLQESMQLTYLFITHDLNLVRHIADRIAVMYFGQIVEIGSKEQLFRAAKHPYTEALFNATPQISHNTSTNTVVITGEVPNPFSPPNGCAFHPRCPKAMPQCKKEHPKLISLTENVTEKHQVACHLY